MFFMQIARERWPKGSPARKDRCFEKIMLGFGRQRAPLAYYGLAKGSVKLANRIRTQDLSGIQFLDTSQ